MYNHGISLRMWLNRSPRPNNQRSIANKLRNAPGLRRELRMARAISSAARPVMAWRKAAGIILSRGGKLFTFFAHRACGTYEEAEIFVACMAWLESNKGRAGSNRNCIV